MEILNSFIAFLGVLICFMANIDAYTFYAGGRDGWVLNPSESYDEWAGRNRFQVNDTIVFRYNKGENSVLLVSKEDYDSCNVNNPQQKLDGGDSTFKFPSSGPFYFISGNQDYCNKGQKLVVTVLALRGTTPTTPTSPPPTPLVASPPAPTTATAPAAPPTPLVASPPTPTTATAPAPPIPTSASPVISPSTAGLVPTTAPTLAPTVANAPAGVFAPVSTPESASPVAGAPGPVGPSGAEGSSESGASFGVSLSRVAVGLVAVAVGCLVV